MYINVLLMVVLFGSLGLFAQDVTTQHVWFHDGSVSADWHETCALYPDRFTAIITSFYIHRQPTVAALVQGLLSSPSLDRILIIQNNPNPKAHFSAELLQVEPELNNDRVFLLKMEENRLINRFFPFEVIRTDAILSLDDDFMIDFGAPGKCFELMFSKWKEHPNVLLGPCLRGLKLLTKKATYHSLQDIKSTPTPTPTSTSNPSSYWANPKWEYSGATSDTHKLILTGFAWFHRQYLHSFWFMMPKEIRQWIEEQQNCEDLAMNFLIANHTLQSEGYDNEQGLFVYLEESHGGIRQISTQQYRKNTEGQECQDCSSLSDRSMHTRDRWSCTDRLMEAFGGMPLSNLMHKCSTHLNLSKKVHQPFHCVIVDEY